ncbi:hypothetical protein EPUS_09193 [Endocarpon pusillum Z07020]|uniref:Uncharacterized protein n=1 Tax=Endocarpon pusillum (strain Z07020 / HMAS-L-300199) TaxID=1263415 RepID=U1HUX7_ENDPU|nr:uncharacterized protein EPUS_09193 [Endocarpon pusillum Z07020]ERF73119.1 hypothetical protein EPUS_09193 [Endocarpon pusillum Z07020]
MGSDALHYQHSSLWPTREQYLWLLRTEAACRGLLFASKKIDLPGPYSCDKMSERYDGDLMPEEWLDVSGSAVQAAPSGARHDQDKDYAQITDSGGPQTVLKTYAWLYLKGIRRNVDEELSEAGATKSELVCPVDAILHDLGTIWASKVTRSHKQEKPQARIGIFSDIPQEETSVEYVQIPYGMTFDNFHTQAAALGIVRYLTTKHHPALAKTLFLEDRVVYHHPYPAAMESSDPSYAHEIYPITRDYDQKDNGWYAHIVPLDPATAATAGMYDQTRDWRPINTEADWKSLLDLLKISTTARKAFMRHKSVDDRMEFIKRHREREELEIAKTGGFCTNVFLSRHMEGMRAKDNFEVPFHPGQNISGEEWLRRVTDQQRREGEVFEDEVDFFAHL